MKKIYKAPSISTVSVYNENVFMKSSIPGAASGTIFDGTEGGADMGHDGDEGDAKKGFWDDDYEE